MTEIFNPRIPLDYDGLMAATDQLKRQYACVSVFSAGKSVLGRSIPAFLFGSGRPGVLYVGGVHALEYITSMLLLRFAGELCSALTEHQRLYGYDVSRMLSAKSFCLLPMLNPDGVELHLHGPLTAGPLFNSVRAVSKGDFSNWQANAHGVDLNHNFNAGFDTLRVQEIRSGITGPAPRQYGGERPESEPETQALCNLCRRLPFARAYAFHSQGEEIYWKYGPRTPRRAHEMALRLAEASGYTVARPEGLAAHGGFKDWFINVFARPGFTLEVGKGVNPLPLGDFDAIYEKIAGMLALGLCL